MKIYYDYQICIGQKYGGISRYYYELLHYIDKLQLAEADMDCKFSINKYFENYFHKKAVRRREGLLGVGIFFASEFINIVNTFFRLRRGYDIVHPTYFNPYIARWKNGAKLVTTVYDMTHEKFSDSFAKRDRTIEQKKKMIMMADHIIAISESTKRDILEIYPEVAPDKISVIYIGSSFSYQADTAVREEFPEEYVLFVGQRGRYKNFQAFFEAMKPSLEKYPKLHLVCIGGGAFSEEEKMQISAWQDRILQMDASDEVLAYAYSHAKCFVFPSLYEGFGIPTLEAFTCGCPVVLSNTSSMPEVGGDAVEYFTPSDVNDMAATIDKVLSDDALREQMREKGYEQLRKFDWETITRQIIECYEKVLKEF